MASRPNPAQISRSGTLPGSPGRKSTATRNPAGKASRPRGKALPVGKSSVGNSRFMTVSTGTSNKALGVTGKMK